MSIDFTLLRIGDEIAEYTDCDEVDLANALTAIEPILKEQAATHARELRAYEATVANLVEALRGVIRVADRATDEFDAAKAAILNATGEPA